ncbi:hypothetical protein IE53DRAFT_63911 [Violaceomyces palustris]|uniref:Uncharacterized protein n=1 Tax=Violaceomyces palustris TaxID=1673888 RepID=A0ACD0NZE7_9BASI|nr:hypothetical protein IE53DRAFT_63911 [Violaceomyces palustris]
MEGFLRKGSGHRDRSPTGQHRCCSIGDGLVGYALSISPPPSPMSVVFTRTASRLVITIAWCANLVWDWELVWHLVRMLGRGEGVQTVLVSIQKIFGCLFLPRLLPSTLALPSFPKGLWPWLDSLLLVWEKPSFLPHLDPWHFVVPPSLSLHEILHIHLPHLVGGGGAIDLGGGRDGKQTPRRVFWERKRVHESLSRREEGDIKSARIEGSDGLGGVSPLSRVSIGSRRGSWSSSLFRAHPLTVHGWSRVCLSACVCDLRLLCDSKPCQGESFPTLRSSSVLRTRSVKKLE